MNKIQRNLECGMRIADCGLFSRHSRGASLFRNPKSEIRNALTLIELMVVIVILMTLVGGVIPVLSPNNEARKIREASRGLRTFIMQAQARAARTGRPVGIAFRETSPGSGVALEVFQIEVPVPFTGFSSSSTAIFNRISPPGASEILYEIHFGEMGGASFYASGQAAIPRLMTRPGDLIQVGNGLFQLRTTLSRSSGEWERVNGVKYFSDVSFYRGAALISGSAPPTFAVDFDLPPSSNITLAPLGTAPPRQWSHPGRYRIMRQPVNTSASPYTLPAGVAIDMHASGTEGGVMQTLFAKATDQYKKKENRTAIKQVGILFSPSGGIESVHYSNGMTFGPDSYAQLVKTPITDASRVFLLLGRVENVVEDMSSTQMAMNNNATDEQLAELQGRINWLNLDSRWVVFDARSGRTVVTDNAFVDTRTLDPTQYDTMNAQVRLPWMQMDAARQIAREMRSGSGG